ncbi:hypothetical protein MWH28_12210 [Natroniella sulfidigena]|uniref:hypothetical protein n=1 Tax=Natroniella sulfidigena TaxID=723921 RepID=UPI00200A3FC8|nr:hypothetical protein [Natroniella sulfidigena]MCK8818120.1 hypothetical protein [Natroniella sulfidigena]
MNSLDKSRQRQADRDLSQYIELYLSGQLENKISNYSARINKQLHSRYYDTSRASKLSGVKVKSLGYSDPTAVRAIKLAHYYYQLRYTLDFLQQLKEVLESLQLSDQDIELLKTKFNCSNKNLEQLSNLTGLTTYKVKQRKKELANMILKRTRSLYENYIARL